MYTLPLALSSYYYDIIAVDGEDADALTTAMTRRSSDIVPERGPEEYSS
jgi:hypothetical protein